MTQTQLIRLALADAETWVKAGDWVTIQIRPGGRVCLDHGAVYPNNNRERSIATTVFETDGTKAHYVHT